MGRLEPYLSSLMCSWLRGAGTRKSKLSLVMLLSILLAACGTPEHPGRQIVFSVLDGKFTNLKIEGKSPEEQSQTWEPSSDSAQTQVLTEGVWWKGTVVLLFDVVDVGERSC